MKTSVPSQVATRLRTAEEPKQKQSQSNGEREKRSKYEEATKAYIDKMVKDIQEAGPSRKRSLQSEAANLKAKDIAQKVKHIFPNATLESVEERIRKTKAWKNRKETLVPVMLSFYDSRTFNERQNTNTPYQELQ